MLDGMSKCLIRHPRDGKTILDHMAESVHEIPITVVVGYKAVEIIERYPYFNYVVNHDWAITNSAYSLGLALDDSPCIVAPGDIFVNKQTMDCLLRGNSDCALATRRENRGLTAINAEICDERINEIYMGPLHDPCDVELVGIFKISSPELLSIWKKNCMVHSNLFCGQTLPVAPALPSISPCFMDQRCMYHEINTVSDYIRLVRSCNGTNN